MTTGQSFITCYAIDTVANWLKSFYSQDDGINGDFRFCSPIGDLLEAEPAAEHFYNETCRRLNRELSHLLGVSYSVIDDLSMTPYEGERPEGNLVIFYPDEMPVFNKNYAWKLDKPIALNSTSVRHIRKLLTSAGENALAFFRDQDNPSRIECIGVVTQPQAEGNRLCIHISGWQEWELRYQDTVILRRFHSGFQVDQSDIQEELLSVIKSEFANKPEYDEYKGLMKTLCVLQKQHGAAVIIIDFEDGQSEEALKRIHKLEEDLKAMKITFRHPSEHDLKNAICHAAKMDGAVIVDLHGQLRYLATILDGNSCISGELSRGARFNSVRNFVASVAASGDDKIIGIILSADGGIDTISPMHFSLCASNSLPASVTAS